MKSKLILLSSIFGLRRLLKHFLYLSLGVLLCAHCQLSSDPRVLDEYYANLLCADRSLNNRFHCGSGTTMEDAYVIVNLSQLQELQTDTSLLASAIFFDVAVDLDLSSIANWQPIGDATMPFMGTFRGARPNNQPVQISNLRIARSTNNIAFFGYTNGATIAKVAMENVNVEGAHRVGGLVGTNDGGTIENCYATGTVVGTNDRVGGLVGYNDGGGTIENSYATGDVMGTGSAVGGLVGQTTSSIINGTNYFVDPNGGDNGIGTNNCSTGATCLRQGAVGAPASLENDLDEAGVMGWTSPPWSRLNEPGFPCIATITFGRGGCPP